MGPRGRDVPVRDELGRLRRRPAWFGLGDLDLATHIARTEWLRDGVAAVEVTAAAVRALAARRAAAAGDRRRVETHVVLLDDGAGRVHFQEWWVRLRAAVPRARSGSPAPTTRQPAPGVARCDRDRRRRAAAAEQPGRQRRHDPRGARHRDARAGDAGARSSGVSPIIGGAPVRGMADACLTAIGVETSAYAVALALRRARRRRPAGRVARRRGRRRAVDKLVGRGHRRRAVPLWMTDLEATAAIAQAALDLAAELADDAPVLGNGVDGLA